MLTYTTCAGCGGAITTGDEESAVLIGAVSHPQCPQPGDQSSLLRNEFIKAVHGGDDALAAELERHLDMLDQRPPDMPASARIYASWGWPVFPLKPGLKVPMIARRDGGSGVLDATTDLARIDDWWQRWPAAGIGVATGHLFDVIDIDGPNGYRWLAEHGGADGPLPDRHALASTPRGEHLYTTPSGAGNLAGLAPGVDYRGKGGYVVLPPTRLTEAAYDKGNGLSTAPARLSYSWTIYPSPAIKRKG